MPLVRVHTSFSPSTAQAKSCATIQAFKRDLDGRRQNTAWPESQNVDTGGLPEANSTAPSDQLRSMKSQRRTAWLLHRSNRDGGLRLAGGPVSVRPHGARHRRVWWKRVSPTPERTRCSRAAMASRGCKHRTQIGTRGRRRGRCARAREEKEWRGRVECLARLRVLGRGGPTSWPAPPKKLPVDLQRKTNGR